jgi:hypothetical protein
MRGRVTLLLGIGLLAVGLALLPVTGDGTVWPNERALNGTWVLTRVEHMGEAFDQLPDAADVHWAALGRDPELRELPVDPLPGVRTITFAGSEFVTHQGDEVTGRGRYTIDGRSTPAVLETRYERYTVYVHPNSSITFTDRYGPVKARLLVRGNQLRLCASDKAGVLPADLRAASEDVYLVTYTRLESVRGRRT